MRRQFLSSLAGARYGDFEDFGGLTRDFRAENDESFFRRLRRKINIAILACGQNGVRKRDARNDA
jgi:hypothetical protein